VADTLKTYRDKRDFTKTAEPEGPGKSETHEGETASPTFVVQKHAARALHYDFRLEVEGVMPSWAVPKGPSYDPKVKRLAVHVEDHPLDYQDFEGLIPGGEYGGGAVIVWDRGTYRNITERDGRAVSMLKAIDGGHVSVWLEGTKLRGGWSLTRTAKPDDRQEAWIMVKRKDEFADAGLDITESAPRSAKTDRRLEDLRSAAGNEGGTGTNDGDPTWTRGRATWSPPMLAELSKSPPPDQERWVYERKFDGLRAIAVRNGDDVELWSRGHQPYHRRFGRIVEALRALPADNFTLDGEIVAFDGERTSFSLLQQPSSPAEPVYQVFDILHLLGSDTRAIPLGDRRPLIAELVEPSDVLRPVDRLTGDASELLEQACRDGWEGIIAKRAESAYRSGRSSDWRKLKCDASQELVIGGWTDPAGGRQYFGAILVGYYDEDGLFRYAGKVGTGFTGATLVELHGAFTARSRSDSPFADDPKVKGAHFIEPDLVADIGFAEWTADGKLRHPKFAGLRSDKAPGDVVREKAMP
jgi:bifunctional non-homologous end joining protein LigD